MEALIPLIRMLVASGSQRSHRRRRRSRSESSGSSSPRLTLRQWRRLDESWNTQQANTSGESWSKQPGRDGHSWTHKANTSGESWNMQMANTSGESWSKQPRRDGHSWTHKANTSGESWSKQPHRDGHSWTQKADTSRESWNTHPRRRGAAPKWGTKRGTRGSGCVPTSRRSCENPGQEEPHAEDVFPSLETRDDGSWLASPRKSIPSDP